eukprot:1257737-Prymnesium_polylepis.1
MLARIGARVTRLSNLVERVRLAREVVCARRRVEGGISGELCGGGSTAPERRTHGRAWHPCVCERAARTRHANMARV